MRTKHAQAIQDPSVSRTPIMPERLMTATLFLHVINVMEIIRPLKGVKVWTQQHVHYELVKSIQLYRRVIMT